MKKGTATRKIPGGKLIRIDVVFSDTLESVKITGDFFLFPEETLDQIELALKGANIPLDRLALTAKIDGALLENQAELVGVSPADVIDTLEEALKA